MKKGYLRGCLALVSALTLSASVLPAGATELSDTETVAWQEDGEVVEDTYEASISDTDIGRFVERLYSIVLERGSDTAGLQNWYTLLTNHTMTGAEVGHGFVFSEEFLDKHLSNEAYVDVLYKTFLDRQPDAGGKANWISELEDGVTRLSVFKGFVESNEYTEICTQYGISRGDVGTPAYKDKSSNVTKFVVRCYRLILDREPDADGLESWCQTLFEDPNGADNIVKGFVFSKEMIEKNLSNEDFVEMLYKTFLNRASDPEGKAGWVEQLENNHNRYDVSCGFIYSGEFKKICQSYGLAEPEEPSAPEDPTKPHVHNFCHYHPEEGYYIDEIVEQAYDEPIIEYHTFCGTCGMDFGCGEDGVNAAGDHIVDNMVDGEYTCQNYYSAPVIVAYNRHDAVTQKVYHKTSDAYYTCDCGARE